MSGKTSIAVLGGGSWGTALAHLLAHAGHSVALLLRDAEARLADSAGFRDTR